MSKNIVCKTSHSYEIFLYEGIRFHIWDTGLACCALEVSAAFSHREWFETVLFSGHATDSVVCKQDFNRVMDGNGDNKAVDIVVISGTITKVLLKDVVAYYDMLKNPKVVSFGACSSGGGPYWDSYSTENGIDAFIPVDMYIPGCPPHPRVFWSSIARLVENEISHRKVE